MVKCLKISACLLGAIIGAGFASGREIVAFFTVSGLNFLSALICCLVSFLFCFVFLRVGSIVKGKTLIEVNKIISPKFSPLFSVAIILNSFIVLSAMTAGVTEIGNDLCGFGFILTAVVFVIVSVLSSKGRKGVLKGGLILVLLMVALVLFIGINGGAFKVEFSTLSVKPTRVILYVAMNMLLAAGVSVVDNNLTAKQCFFVAALTSVAIGVLAYILATVIRRNGVSESEMPILDLAFRMGKVEYYAAVLLLLLSIITTMLTCLCDVVEFLDGYISCRALSIFVTLSISLIVSLIGFSDVIALFYPVIGIIGVLYFALCFVKLFSPAFYKLFHKRNREVHKRGKQAKNHG